MWLFVKDTDMYYDRFIVPITMMIVSELYCCVRQINVLSIYLSIQIILKT